MEPIKEKDISYFCRIVGDYCIQVFVIVDSIWFVEKRVTNYLGYVDIGKRIKKKIDARYRPNFKTFKKMYEPIKCINVKRTIDDKDIIVNAEVLSMLRSIASENKIKKIDSLIQWTKKVVFPNLGTRDDVYDNTIIKAFEA
jgi:hypothetical protein